MNPTTTPRTRTLARILTALAILAVAGCSKREQGESPAGSPGKSHAVARAESAPAGWTATYSASGGRRATSHSPTAAFAILSGESVHPAIPAAGLGAEFEAIVAIGATGLYRFGAEIEGGTVEVSVTLPSGVTRRAALSPSRDGAPAMSDPMNLTRGDVLVRYTFRREGDARARLRPMWSMARDGLEGFKAEPIPSRAVGVVAALASADTGAAAVHRGRVLLGEFGCINCHEADGHLSPDRAAPDLARVGQRAAQAWLAEWVASPQDMKPGCGMPDVIGEAEAGDAAAIAAFLVSLSEPVEWPAPATESAVLEAGRELYESVGCMACHGAADAGENGGHEPSQPFGRIAGKWNVAALSAYLRAPHEARPSGQMPSLLLTEEESDAIAQHLVAAWGAGTGGGAAPSPDLVASGREAFVAHGCASCHAVEGIDPGPRARALADLSASGGCLDPGDTSTPRYALSERDSGALAAAIEAARDWGELHPAPADAALLTVSAHRCSRCHTWHGSGGPDEAIRDRFVAIDDTDLGDEGRFPPDLSGVGWKLSSQWLERVLGEGARARPYMKTRMPDFASHHVAGLTAGLASLDGVWPASDDRPPEVNDELVQAGLQLVGTAGFNCIACHVFGDAPPAGRPGPDIAQFGERLRYDWFSTYIHNPARFKPGTMMSRFFMTEKSTQPVLGADIDRQVDAMWSYFSLGELFMPAPEGIQTPGALAVQVLGEPTIFRTFLQGVGSRGIALGFPAGVHFAYDANTARLAYSWTGSFLDASGAWAGRGGTPVSGQGPTVWTAPAGPAVAVGELPGDWDGAPGWSFTGYSLDDAGVPTFRSRLGGVSCEETLRPYPHEGALFSRTIVLRGLGQGQSLWVRPGPGASVARTEGGSAEVEGEVVGVTAQSDSVTIVLEVSQ